MPYFIHQITSNVQEHTKAIGQGIMDALSLYNLEAAAYEQECVPHAR